METPTVEQVIESRKTANKDRVYRASIQIKAAATTDLPSRIMVMKTGDWSDSWKGNLRITEDDLRQYKANFEASIGLPGRGEVGLPIDFGHMDFKEAAAWIKGLEVAPSDDPVEAAQGVMALYANPVEWTDEGAEKIRGGSYKCISPSFYPAGRGGWEDPEDMDRHVDNVLVGAGLTNIPFFSGLSPVMASTSDGKQEEIKNVIFINASTKEGEKRMTLDELRVKDAATLNDEEKKFLADHKAELSGEEQVKFGLVEATKDDPKDAVTDEERQILADIRDGKVKTVKAEEAVVDASRIQAMQEQLDAYAKRDAEAVVDAHVKRGAIKGDSRDRWVTRLLSASKTDRAELEADLTAIPSNEAISKELGKDGHEETDGTTREQIAKLAASKVKEASAKGETLDFVEAQKQVMAENPELAEQDRQANKIN